MPLRRGTPAHAIGDGVAIYKGWSGGGGNTLKLKGYLHLKAYVQGISKYARGNRDLIGRRDRSGTGPAVFLILVGFDAD